MPATNPFTFDPNNPPPWATPPPVQNPLSGMLSGARSASRGFLPGPLGWTPDDMQSMQSAVRGLVPGPFGWGQPSAAGQATPMPAPPAAGQPAGQVTPMPVPAVTPDPAAGGGAATGPLIPGTESATTSTPIPGSPERRLSGGAFAQDVTLPQTPGNAVPSNPMTGAAGSTGADLTDKITQMLGAAVDRYTIGSHGQMVPIGISPGQYAGVLGELQNARTSAGAHIRGAEIARDTALATANTLSPADMITAVSQRLPERMAANPGMSQADAIRQLTAETRQAYGLQNTNAAGGSSTTDGGGAAAGGAATTPLAQAIGGSMQATTPDTIQGVGTLLHRLAATYPPEQMQALVGQAMRGEGPLAQRFSPAVLRSALYGTGNNPFGTEFFNPLATGQTPTPDVAGLSLGRNEVMRQGGNVVGSRPGESPWRSLLRSFTGQ